jgi:hypothetical protein
MRYELALQPIPCRERFAELLVRDRKALAEAPSQSRVDARIIHALAVRAGCLCLQDKQGILIRLRDDHGREARTNRENARAMTWLLAVNDKTLPEAR